MPYSEHIFNPNMLVTLIITTFVCIRYTGVSYSIPILNSCNSISNSYSERLNMGTKISMLYKTWSKINMKDFQHHAHECHKSSKQEKRSMNSYVNWYFSVYWGYKNKGKCKHSHKVCIFNLKTSESTNPEVWKFSDCWSSDF